MKKALIVTIIIIIVAFVNVSAHLFFGANTPEFNPYFLWGMRIINFVLLAGLLAVLLKDPASVFFSSKSKELKENLAEAERKVKEAEDKKSNA